MGKQAAVVAGDDDSASTSGLDIIHMVFCMKPFLAAGILENIGILSTSNAADVGHRVRRKHIQSPTGVFCAPPPGINFVLWFWIRFS